MADTYQGEATRSIRAAGFNTFKNPDMQFDRWGKPRFQQTPGKPDMDVWGGGRFTMIEVKDGYDSFAFANFEQNKKDYIRDYCTPAPYLVQVWVWLCLGTGMPHQSADKNPRLTWLIPIQAWYEAENKVMQYQKSIPYLAGPDHKIILREQNLDAVHLFERFVLKWIGKGTWAIPKKHPYAELFMNPAPLPMYQQEAQPHVGNNVNHTGRVAGNIASRSQHFRNTGCDIATHVAARKGHLPARQFNWSGKPAYEYYASDVELPMAYL